MLDRYAQATVADLNPTLRDWDFGGGRGLLLHGPAGTGKTHAAVALFKRERERPPAKFVSVARFLFEKKRQMSGPTDWREPDWRGVRFVVLDDFDKARLTEWAREELFIAIDTLYNRCVPIVVTSNLTPAQFAQHVGPYVADRLKEMVVPVPMLGASRRRAPDVPARSHPASHAQGGHGQPSPADGLAQGASHESELVAGTDCPLEGERTASDGVEHRSDLSPEEWARAEARLHVLLGRVDA
jgi:hypothetical protein